MPHSNPSKLVSRFSGSDFEEMVNIVTRHFVRRKIRSLSRSTNDDEVGLMAALEALAVECVTGTKVIVIGRSNDLGLYKKLLDAGVSDYLVTKQSPRPVKQPGLTEVNRK